MIIHVKLFATLLQKVPDAKSGIPFDVELVEGATIADLVRFLSIPDEEVKITFVNGLICPDHHILYPGDQVGIFPPVGGG